MIKNIEKFDEQFKILILWDAFVEKTSLQVQVSEDNFMEKYQKPIDFDFINFIVKLNKKKDTTLIMRYI